MTIEQTKSRLKELRKIKRPSDQELEEILALEKHLTSLQNTKTKPEQKREKRTILQVILERLKEKPATEEEIKQLKLEAEKYKLKADIAKSKAEIKKSKGNNFSLGGSTSQRSGANESYSSQEDKISGLLRGAVKTKDVDFFSSDSKPDIFSKNDSDQSEKEKEAYRKKTLGF